MGLNVELAYVVPSFAPLGPEEVMGQRLEWQQYRSERGRKMLRDMTAALELPEGRVESLVLYGDVAARLPETGSTALILVGRRPHAARERRRSPGAALAGAAARGTGDNPRSAALNPEWSPARPVKRPGDRWRSKSKMTAPRIEKYMTWPPHTIG